MSTQNKQQGFTAGDMADQYATAFERGRESVLAEQRAAAQEAVAWMTHHDEPMLYPTFAEAAAYCDDGESPIPLYAASVAAAPGIDLDAVERLRNLAVYAGTVGCPSMGGDIKALLDALDANPKGGSEARALLGALVSLVAVARRYLPDYDEHPEVQKADDAIDAAMQAQTQAGDAEVPNG